MTDTAQMFEDPGKEPQSVNPVSGSCIMLIFGSSGGLTKRLLVPALYNLACDGLLSENFAVLGAGRSPLITETFREHLGSDDQGIRKYHTRKTFDEAAWGKSKNPLASIWHQRGNSTRPFLTTGMKTRSTGSTITSARRRRRTCLHSGFPTACSSRFGTRILPIISSLMSAKRWTSATAAVITVATTETLEHLPMFKGADALLLNSVIMALRPLTATAGEVILQKRDSTKEMYLICHGEVEVIDGMGKADFSRILRDHPQFGDAMMIVAKERYHLTVLREQLMAQ